MSTAQAEALAEALTIHAFDQLATKADLSDLELRLTVRLGTMLAGSTALTVAILGTLITLS